MLYPIITIQYKYNIKLYYSNNTIPYTQLYNPIYKIICNKIYTTKSLVTVHTTNTTVFHTQTNTDPIFYNIHKYHTKNTTKCTIKYYKYININISIINNNLSLNNKYISNNNKCAV